MQEINQAISKDYSAWISASAGTGKTKLLIDRIVNLLVSGVPPENILCITFTNAAKGEMISRINKSLIEIQNLSYEDSILKLNSLSIEASKKNINKLKDIYDRYLSSQNKVQIFTIHGFCQSILQRFPIEAGLKPHFSILDDISSQIIINKILGSEDFSNKISLKLKEKISFIYLRSLMVEYLEHYGKYPEISKNINNICLFFKNLSTKYNIKNIENIKEALKNKIKKNLNDKSYKKIQKINIIRECNFLNEEFIEIFLTKEYKARQKVFSKKILSEFPQLEEDIKDLQQDFENYYNLYRLSEYIDTNLELLSLSSELYLAYENYKEKNNLRDFNDLISLCYNLICSSDTKEWIKYKLDQSFDHILVDESQDTSESQWKIIKSLVEDFFSGYTANEEGNRSLFIVGDIKQSIYGFQGARPDLFLQTRNNLKQRAKDANIRYIDTVLKKTYRIPSSIFKFIKNIFEDSNLIEQVLHIECERSDGFSSIEIWDLEDNKKENNIFWPFPEDILKIENSEKKLAQKIASYIKSLLDSNLYIESKKRSIQPSDFMILLQKRSSLNEYIHDELEKLKIPNSGLDRIDLKNSFIVNDILSALKFVINPHDKLNLVSLLKSYLFNFDDEFLYKISNCDMYEYIKSEKPEIYDEITHINQLFYNNNLKDFILKLISEYDLLNSIKNSNNLSELDALTSFISYIEKIFMININISVSEFIYIFTSTNISIKRDFSMIDAVRINTVHGAKGLESPIVIIADANYFSRDIKSRILEYEYDNTIIPILSSSINIKELDHTKSSVVTQNYEEYLRLLYVAITRVQDHLVICGTGANKNSDKKTWYEMCKTSINDEFVYEDNKYILKKGTPHYLENNQNKPILQKTNLIQKKVQNNKFIQKEKYNFNSESAIEGTKTHLELENLVKNFPDANDCDSKYSFIFKNSNFIKFLSMNYYPEAEIITKSQENLSKILRLDLIAFDEINNEIHIIDYKTDISKSNNYNNKLAEYKFEVGKIYSNYNIRTYIYWIKLDLVEEIFEL